MILSKIIQDQITRHTRKELGVVKIPILKALTYKETQLVSSPDNTNLVWNKRFYKLDRSNNPFISRDDFLDTSEYITNSVMSPTSDGSLSDSNIGINSNIEYAIELYTKISKSYIFKFNISFGSYVSIYQRVISVDGTSTLGVLTGSQSNSGTIQIDFPSNKWITILVYYYTSRDDASINGFSPLIQVVDSWRIPDIEPPPVPSWATTALTTVTNPLTGVSSNTLHWNVPDSKDWAGNGIYYYIEEDTGHLVSQQYPDASLNAIIINTGDLTALKKFPAGSNLFLNI